MSNPFSKAWKKITNQDKIVVKGDTPDKESIIREDGAYATGDFVDPEFTRVSYSDIQLLYDKSSLLKKYVKAIVDEIKRYPLIAKPVDSKRDDVRAKSRAAELNKLFRKSNKTESFMSVREKYVKDLFLYGRGGVEIEPSTVDEAKALYAVPGYAIRLNVDQTGSFKDDKNAYKLVDPDDTTTEVASLPVDSLIFMVLDKMSDRVYGSDPITSIYTDLNTDLTTSKNIQAGSNTVKSGIICLPKAPRKLLKDIVDRMMMLCKRNSRTRIVATNTDGKFLDISNLNPEDNIKLQKWLFKKANIWNIPLFKLGIVEDTGSLNAREQMNDFREMIESLVKYEIDQFNAILISSKLKWDDVEISCPNFATKLDYERARIAVRLVNGRIITPNEAREKYLGLPKSEDDRADRLVFPEDLSNSDTK